MTCTSTYRFTDPVRTVSCDLEEGHPGPHHAEWRDGIVLNTYGW